MKPIRLSVVVVLAFVLLRPCSAEPDIKALLEKSDQARAGGLPGLVWDVRVTNTGSSVLDDEPAVLRLKSSERASLAEYMAPLRSKGSRILQVGRNMWYSKPGLRKPVAISPRQRLTGEAAIGDIAATNYARDYDAKYLGELTMDDEPCYLLDLSAAKSNATYDRIKYWISVTRGVGVHAEFLSVSGKTLKTADFDYKNTIEVKDSVIPFVSNMTIRDALTDSVTTLEYSNIKVESVPRFVFDPANLQ